MSDVLLVIALGAIYAVVFSAVGVATARHAAWRRVAGAALALAGVATAAVVGQVLVGVAVGAGLVGPAFVYLWIGRGLRDPALRPLAAGTAVATLPFLAIAETAALIVLFLSQCGGCIS